MTSPLTDVCFEPAVCTQHMQSACRHKREGGGQEERSEGDEKKITPKWDRVNKFKKDRRACRDVWIMNCVLI